MNITLNNGVVHARHRARRLPKRRPKHTTARGRGRAGQPATGTSTRPPRTATSARSGRASAAPASTVPRSFIETKVWVSDYGYDQTLHAFEKSDRQARRRLPGPVHPAPARCPSAFEKTIAAYKALEQLLADGRVRAIGVSNFMPNHLAALLDSTDVVPAVNQIELHPYFSQPDVQAADAQHGILTQAWSPIGGITFYPGWGEDRGTFMDDPAIIDIADGARQDAGPGDAALAAAAGPFRHPEVDQSSAHRRELRRL